MTNAYFRCADNGFSNRSMSLIKEDAVNRSYTKHQQLMNDKTNSCSSIDAEEVDLERYFYYLTY